MPRITQRDRITNDINNVNSLIDIEHIIAAAQDRRRHLRGDVFIVNHDEEDIDDNYSAALSVDSSVTQQSLGSQQSINGAALDVDDYLELHPPVQHETYHLGPLHDFVIEEECNCEEFNNNIGSCLREHRSNNWLSIDFDQELTLATATPNDSDREKNNLQRKRVYSKVWINLDPRFINHAEGNDYGYARVKLPACAYSLIRMIWPSSTGRYMGFRQS